MSFFHQSKQLNLKVTVILQNWLAAQACTELKSDFLGGGERGWNKVVIWCCNTCYSSEEFKEFENTCFNLYKELNRIFFFSAESMTFRMSVLRFSCSV